jgi:hypothetical protein
MSVHCGECSDETIEKALRQVRKKPAYKGRRAFEDFLKKMHEIPEEQGE